MLYIDSADLDEISPLLETGLFAGVTTNPTILARSGLTARDLPGLAEWVRARGASRFFAQATGDSVQDIRRSAWAIAELGADVVVKVMCTPDGLTVGRELTESGREVLVTAAYHPSQILLARAARAQFIAPYVGRASDAGRDGTHLVASMSDLNPGPEITRIVAASLRSVDALTDAMAAGAHDATIAPTVARALLADDLTGRAHAEFERITNERPVGESG
jgi:transaldolase